jgi:hypothetical protein
VKLKSTRPKFNNPMVTETMELTDHSYLYSQRFCYGRPTRRGNNSSKLGSHLYRSEKNQAQHIHVSGNDGKTSSLQCENVNLS